jgi:DNA-binding XRE family transcriptional regulator
MALGNEIQRLRKERGMTQRQLGELVGLSWVSVARIEAGKQMNNLKTLRKVLNVFGLCLVLSVAPITDKVEELDE